MLRKTTLRILCLLPFVAGIPNSCTGPCGPFEQFTYEITGHTLTVSASSNNYSDVVFSSEFETKRISKLKFNLTPFSTPLYACSPPPPVFTQQVIGMSMVTGTDYNSDYPAGKDLSSLLESTSEFLPLEFPLDLESFNGRNYRFSLPPDAAINASFEVTFELADGTSWDDSKGKVADQIIDYIAQVMPNLFELIVGKCLATG